VLAGGGLKHAVDEQEAETVARLFRIVREPQDSAHDRLVRKDVARHGLGRRARSSRGVVKSPEALHDAWQLGPLPRVRSFCRARGCFTFGCFTPACLYE